jgi:hypothetical protein
LAPATQDVAADSARQCQRPIGTTEIKRATTTPGAPTREPHPEEAQLHTAGHKSITIRHPVGRGRRRISVLSGAPAVWRYHECRFNSTIHLKTMESRMPSRLQIKMHISRALRARTDEQKLDEIALAIAELAKYVEDIEKDKLSNSSTR